MRKHVGAVRIVIFGIVCFSGGLLIGKYWGYIKLSREVQAEIYKYQLQKEANSRYLDSLEKERDCLLGEYADLKKERDEAIRQRNIAVRAVDAIFRAGQITASSKQTKTRRTRPTPP